MTSNQRGFSLIEVMISFCLISVGALGLVKMQTYIEQRADYASQSIQALGLAESQLEWFRTRGADAAMSTLPIADFDADIVDGIDATHSPFLIEWTIDTGLLEGRVKTIDIEVTWPGRAGQHQSINLQTKLTQYSEFD
ncbi:type IV pilin [Vibrio sp. 10N.286.49.C2]|uniref:type IV pilus modification PilV family protein n=1 Tax=unclassified Vibrio TaxID=2614977 RepID=UPI000C845826|nr:MULTISPECIES: prepilin-type N-terminal cleavage/methylation domain-containing protein [unclassified Vibrio]PMH36300.1 type IV pilin [Vibrio sp. 10N.286.49.C2]PMH53416.1 type IV pilin [Vibrio sp. 10N.286.49.B1]PMH80694.1 type IV pilin [Vibrio sp. 10N.286.48.B7]